MLHCSFVFRLCCSNEDVFTHIYFLCQILQVRAETIGTTLNFSAAVVQNCRGSSPFARAAFWTWDVNWIKTWKTFMPCSSVPVDNTASFRQSCLNRLCTSATTIECICPTWGSAFSQVDGGDDTSIDIEYRRCNIILTSIFQMWPGGIDLGFTFADNALGWKRLDGRRIQRFLASRSGKRRSKWAIISPCPTL